MSYFYAASTGGFYTREIHGNSIPSDAKPVTKEEHAALMAGQSSGQRIVAVNGVPSLQSPPPESWAAAKERALALLRAERAPVFAGLDGLQATAATAALSSILAGSNATAATYAQKAQQIETLKQGLRNAPNAINFAAYTTFEQMRLAGKAYYASLVTGAAPEVVAAFKEVA